MFVKSTMGQVLGVGALAFAGRQFYKRYAGKKQKNQEFKAQEDKLDHMLEDSFPASDPMPLSRSGSGR